MARRDANELTMDRQPGRQTGLLSRDREELSGLNDFRQRRGRRQGAVTDRDPIGYFQGPEPDVTSRAEAEVGSPGLVDTHGNHRRRWAEAGDPFILTSEGQVASGSRFPLTEETNDLTTSDRLARRAQDTVDLFRRGRAIQGPGVQPAESAPGQGTVHPTGVDNKAHTARAGGPEQQPIEDDERIGEE